jgi:hypothetical protein
MVSFAKLVQYNGALGPQRTERKKESAMTDRSNVWMPSKILRKFNRIKTQLENGTISKKVAWRRLTALDKREVRRWGRLHWPKGRLQAKRREQAQRILEASVRIVAFRGSLHPL